ncbi:MAG TPA: hypothetical protein VF852_04825 [Pseudolabrys sp.]
MDAPVIRVADHREAINRVLAHYGLGPDALEVVPSVFDWCKTNGVPGDHIGRMAICLCNWETGACRIAMREQFSGTDFENANAAMLVRGFRDELDRLNTSENCLLHLLLHEVACHVIKSTEQVPRDTWAFAELDKHDI